METGQDDFTKAEMNLKSCALSLRNPVKLHLLLLCSLLLGVPLTDQLVAQTPPVIVDLDSTELEAQAIRVLSTYCASCHGTVKQNGQVQLDALETIDAVARQSLLGKVQDVIHLNEMPPEEAKQPSQGEREILLRWLDQQLTGDVSKALAEKLLRFEYGNVVNHKELFSGKHANLKGYTPDRRWLISEFIFNEKINRLLDYHPTRTIYGTTQPVQGDSGIHWSPKTERGDKFRRTITNPYLLPEKVGVRYSVHSRLTTGHLLTMIGNAKRVAGHLSSEATMKANFPAMYALMKTELDHRETLRSREQFLKTFPFTQRLLQEIYGDQHDALLPKLIRKEIPYPGPPEHSQNGIQKRHENLGFLDRFDHEDIRAILQGIATYKRSAYEVTENTDAVELDLKGNPVWAPYSDKNRAEFDSIIEQSERDWYMEGMTDYRIQNRIATMKLFFDTWDMNRLYSHVKNGNFVAPEYKPLKDSEMAKIKKTIKKHRKQDERFHQIIDKCLAEWKASFKAQREAAGGDEEMLFKQLIFELYEKMFERSPTDTEITENLEQLNLYMDKLDRQQSITKLIESLLLSTEFAYRNEFGQEIPDEHHRRMMSPRDASYALAYALTDASPDKELVKAVKEGRLISRADYEREIRRMLNRRDQWFIVDENVQAANLNASVTNQPIRKLRFFREFFGYPKALKVFKDDSRFGAGRHEQAVSRLIDEADMLVEHVLEMDKLVFEELLTTDKFFIYHSGDNNTMKSGSDQLKLVYQHFRNLPWESWEPDDIEVHKEFMLTIWEFRKVRGGDNKSLLTALKRMMPLLDLHFSRGQANGMPYMKMGMGFWHGGNVIGRTGQQMRGEQVTSYWNLDWKTWDYPTHQPARVDNRKGILTHPAWLIAHSQNLETDPIHRGKWIREKLLAGTIPDVPITVDAVIPPDHHKTLRQRMENRTGATYCWRCHQKMDPLGFPLEIYDDFGRFRTQENLEHPDNLIRAAKRGEVNEFGASLPIYKTLAVEPHGVLQGTEDATLDGDVVDAFDLIDRLAKSDKVRQSIIRYAFRYFLGRNETLSDSKTLINADNAYLSSNGSFDEVIVSLLTSDSFIYRKRNTEE
jgi:cytochrome c553/ABC-type oligopeptide transport system ATPase subunit